MLMYFFRHLSVSSTTAGNHVPYDFDRLLPCKRPGIVLPPVSMQSSVLKSGAGKRQIIYTLRFSARRFLDLTKKLRLTNHTLMKILLFLACFSIMPVHAAWYQVEAIVFDRIFPDSDGELWIKDPGLPAQQNRIELITDIFESDSLVPYQVLPKGKYRMHGIYRTLKNSKNYRPLIHVSWQQPAASRNKARAVHLEKFKDDANDSVNTADSEVLMSMLQPVINGFVKIRSSHFLHVDVDLVYYPDGFLSTPVAVNDDQRFNNQIDYVRLIETRKIKLNELHYFDHPMFGIILQVSRLRPGE